MAEGHKFIQKAINEHHESEAMEEIYEKWDGALKAVFDFYVKQHAFDIRELVADPLDKDNDTSYKVLYFKEIILFFKDFRIIPVFLKVEGIDKELKRLKVKRAKRQDPKRQITYGLNFDEFKQLLLRVSLRAQKKFQIFLDKYKLWEDRENNDIVKDTRKKDGDEESDEDDEEKGSDEEDDEEKSSKKNPDELDEEDQERWDEGEWNDNQDFKTQGGGVDREAEELEAENI